jgi:hypothetical protein
VGGGAYPTGRGIGHAGGKARVLENALTKVNADLDTKQAKDEATRKGYLDEMAAHTAHAKHSLGLDEMLGEKVELDGREWDLNMCEVALVEA